MRGYKYMYIVAPKSTICEVNYKMTMCPIQSPATGHMTC